VTGFFRVEAPNEGGRNGVAKTACEKTDSPAEYLVLKRSAQMPGKGKLQEARKALLQQASAAGKRRHTEKLDEERRRKKDAKALEQQMKKVPTYQQYFLCLLSSNIQICSRVS
jgi:hypothetical protein